MKKLAVIIAVMSLMFVTGCFKQENVTKKIVSSENTFDNISVAEDFDFANAIATTPAQLSITSNNLDGEEFAVYAGDDTNSIPVLEGMFASDQTYNIEIPIETTEKFVTVVSKNGSFESFKTDIVNNGIKFTCNKEKVSPVMKRASTTATSIVDPTRWKALVVYGTLAFEDKWPNKGDYDFNDVVINYAVFKLVNIFTGKINGVVYNFSPAASGAENDSGFGIQLNNNLKLSDIQETFMLKNLFSTAVYTSETLVKPTYIFTDNVKTMFNGYNSSNVVYNTIKTDKYYSADVYTFCVLFKKGISISKVDYRTINPFITINGERTKEVHLKGFAPTEKADTSIFGLPENDDGTNLDKKLYYMSKVNNLPWALDIPCKWYYPTERVGITDAYPDFFEWASNDGNKKKEWYKKPILGKVY